MKTQIILLEPHDDTISVKDKMEWSQTGRVVLVWPARAQLMDRRLDLVLLQRHSGFLGVQIALVTSDPEVRFNAGQLEIPVFRSVRKAQTGRWARKRRKRSAYLPPESGTDRLTRIQSLLADPLHAAEKLTEAARILTQQPQAIQLRYMQTLTEITTDKSSTIVFPLPMDLIKPLMEK